MRRILTTVITIYWTACFAVLAMMCTMQLDHGLVEAFRLLGLTHITSAVSDAGGVWLTGMFGVAFALVSLVFVWALVANVLDESRVGEADEILRLAFASGGFTLTVLLFSAGVLSVSGVFPAMTVQFGAMLVSYLAACAERSSLAGTGSSEARTPDTSRVTALLAHSSTLRPVGTRYELPR